MMSENEVINLNVGGVMYTTTRSTLTKYPDSMIGAMFNGNYIPTACDQQGNYFIDRDGYMFRHVLNFLRCGRVCLPQGFKDFDLLEAEADYYQIPPMISAIKNMKKGAIDKPKDGYYIEIMDLEETTYFYSFYTDTPSRLRTDCKNGGLVLSGAKQALLTLPLPEKVMKDLESSESTYRTIKISSGACSKMAILHQLQAAGWQLVTTSFANSTDTEGSYMVHKYMWYLPA